MGCIRPAENTVRYWTAVTVVMYLFLEMLGIS